MSADKIKTETEQTNLSESDVSDTYSDTTSDSSEKELSSLEDESSYYDSESDKSDYFIPDDNEEDIEDNVHVPNDERISRPFLHYYEFVRVISERAKQLSLGAAPMIKSKHKSHENIAIDELKQNKLPFKIIRKRGNLIETWNLSELDKSLISL